MWKCCGWAVLMVTAGACDAPPQPDPQSIPAARSEPTTTASSAPSLAEVIPAKAPASDPFAELLSGDTKPNMLDAKAYILEPKARIGVYFGLPIGWRYDDPSYMSLSPIDSDAPGRFAITRLSEPDLTPANMAKLLKRGPLPALLRDATWGAWRDGVAGRSRWRAKIVRGEAQPVIRKHGALATLAAVIAVPDTPAVGFMAAWPKDKPELEATMLDIARHLHRCRIKVGLGCVADPSNLDR